MRTQPVRRKKNRAGRVSFLMIGVFLVTVLSIQMVRLYQKNQEYVEREEALTNQVQELEKQKEELSEYEGYINSKEYVEDTAKKKLGLVYDNEIIFREE